MLSTSVAVAALTSRIGEALFSVKDDAIGVIVSTGASLTAVTAVLSVVVLDH